MAKIELIISEEFLNNLSDYLNECGVEQSSLIVKIWKTESDRASGECQVVSIGSASLFQVVDRLASLYEDGGCAEICFNDSFCDECFIHSDNEEVYMMDDYLKELEKQSALKAGKESALKADLFQAPMYIPPKRWDTNRADNYYEIFFLYKRRGNLITETPMSVRIGCYWKEYHGEMVWCINSLANVMRSYFSVDMARVFKDGRVLTNRAAYTAPIRKVVNMKRERVKITELSPRENGIGDLF